MSHYARELGPIALRALQKESRLRVYKLLHSSLYRINRLLSYKVIAAAGRFNPCTYCRANTLGFNFSILPFSTLFNIEFLDSFFILIRFIVLEIEDNDFFRLVEMVFIEVLASKRRLTFDSRFEN